MSARRVGVSRTVSVGRVTGSASWPFAVAALSPMAWYRHGEASGTTMLDSSGNGRVGTYTAMTLGVTGATTDADTAITANGATPSHGDVTHAAWMDNLTAFTLAQWVKFTSSSAMVGIADSGGANWTFGLFANTSGTPALSVANTGTVTSVTGGFNDGAWHLFAGTWDHAASNTAKIYADGTLLNTTTVTVANTGTSSGIQIGGRNSTAYWTGSLDESLIFNYALTGTQISTLYAAR